MKKNEQNELEHLFSDARFKPDNTFKKQLAMRVGVAPPRRRVRWQPMVIGVFAAVALVFGIAMFAPTSKEGSKLAEMILLKDIFARASASEINDKDGVTFWDITERGTKYGPAASQCQAGQSSDVEETSRKLLFKKGAVSAVFSSAGSYGADSMVYSDDAQIPAFESSDYFGKSAGNFRHLIGAKPTFVDEAGNEVQGETAVPVKKAGNYDVYARVDIQKNDKEYLEGCSTFIIHMRIDAVSMMSAGEKVYNQVVSEDTLFWQAERSIVVGYGDFESVLPEFVKAGFDIVKAKVALYQVGVAEVNKDAGYAFYYPAKFFGKKTLAQEEGIYTYQFANFPNTIVQFRAEGTQSQYPARIDDLRRLAEQKGWKVVVDEAGDADAYGNDIMTRRFEVESATTRYILSEPMKRYGSLIQTIYIEAPLQTGKTKVFNDYSQEYYSTDYLAGLSWGGDLFEPGTEPPISL